MNTKTKGNIAEQKAAQFLKNNNFKIIERNFYTKFGEIDIIAFKNSVFHFIEVKSGKNFEPVYNITPAKLQRIIKSAYVYLKKHNINSAFCIDAIIIKNDIEFIQNITF
ncbi:MULTISPECIES: YraN family protein [unclassified Lebetimonas]|uniref:YraN family protein n=1 Tax=unclassified Lebetimonas TaxID=2648158 RepID=UPI0004AE042C|nr:MULTISPECIES: YraN family protein [unclassified Lebetimonas]